MLLINTRHSFVGIWLLIDNGGKYMAQRRDEGQEALTRSAGSRGRMTLQDSKGPWSSWG